MNSLTLAGSYQVSSLAGFSIETRSVTSCSMSLSLETMTTSQPASAALRLSVPITSSASKPAYWMMGMRRASMQTARRKGSARSRSGGVSARLALYSAYSSSRCVLPMLSKMAAMYCGSKVRESLRSMLVKDEDGFGGEAGGGAHGRRAGAGARMVGAEDEAVGIDEENARRWHCRLSYRISHPNLPDLSRANPDRAGAFAAVANPMPLTLFRTGPLGQSFGFG